jgi:hypothetical protein
MRTRCWVAACVLGLALPLAAGAQEETKVTGRVIDAAGKPVAGAEVASFWSGAEGTMQPYKADTTDAGGRFATKLTFYGPGAQALLALDKDRKTGGLALVDSKSAGKPVEIKFAPLVHVHGRFACKELGRKLKWTNVYLMSGQARFLMCSSEEASFSFRVPPGTYKFWGYGTDIQDLHKDLTLNADKPDVDLGTLDMAPTVIARHVGKAPPAWHVTDARGLKKGVRLSDFKGKWVLIEFWGFW